MAVRRIDESTKFSAAEVDFVRAVGRRVRLLRANAGLSQEKLASLAGVDRNFVSQLELGYHSPNVIGLRRLAQALGATAEAILDNDSLIVP